MTEHLGDIIYCFKSVFVKKAYRGKGVFRLLYNHFMESARSNPNVKCVQLFVENENIEAQKVYEKVGMKKREDWYFMEKGIKYT